eukprot:2166030-Pyramimonas_sp.AAC.1
MGHPGFPVCLPACPRAPPCTRGACAPRGAGTWPPAAHKKLLPRRVGAQHGVGPPPPRSLAYTLGDA